MMNHLTLHILSTRQQMGVDVKGKTILGRASGIDEEGTLYIDLSPFLAYQLGVSRRHLMFVPEDGQILAFDLSSHNGSQLNGDIMESRRGYPVKDGDEFLLGSLEIRVYMTSEVPYKDMQTRQLPTFEEATQKTKTNIMPTPKPDIRETLTGTRPLSIDLLQSLEKDQDQASRV